MIEFLSIILTACLANNLVLHYMLAAAPIEAVSRRVDTAAGLGLVVGCVILLTTPLCWWLDYSVLQPNGLRHFRTLAFLLLIAAAVTLGRGLLARLRPALQNRVAVFFPFALLNSGILGAALLSVDAWHGLMHATAWAAGAGAGFALVSVLFAGLQERALSADVPATFRGVPLQLLIFGFLSMAFMGFAGIGH